MHYFPHNKEHSQYILGGHHHLDPKPMTVPNKDKNQTNKNEQKEENYISLSLTKLEKNFLNILAY